MQRHDYDNIGLGASPIAVGDLLVYHAAVDAATTSAERHKAEQRAVAALVRNAFGSDAVLCHDDTGAPAVDGVKPRRISVSHCSGVAFLAVSPDCPVGIDAEWEDERLLSVVPRVMGASEFAANGCDVASLADVWTAKEAAFKALGIGDIVISEIAVDGDMAQGRGKRVKIRYLRFGALHIALAIAGE